MSIKTLLAEKHCSCFWYKLSWEKSLDTFSGQNISNWETIHASIVSQISESYCSIANVAARDADVPDVTSTIVVGFHIQVKIQYLQLFQKVDIVFSSNFDMWLLLFDNFEYKSALRWQKTIYDQIFNTPVRHIYCCEGFWTTSNLTPEVNVCVWISTILTLFPHKVLQEMSQWKQEPCRANLTGQVHNSLIAIMSLQKQNSKCVKQKILKYVLYASF